MSLVASSLVAVLVVGLSGCRSDAGESGPKPKDAAAKAVEQPLLPGPRAACASSPQGCFRLLSARMTSPRLFFSAITLDDGRVLIVGGSTRAGEEFRINSTEFFDPKLNRFVEGPVMRYPRSALTLTRLADGRVLVAGGDYSANAEVFDPKTNQFLPEPLKLLTRRVFLSSTLLPDGRVLLVGGQNKGILSPGEPSEVLDIAKWQTSAGDVAPDKRFAHTTTMMSDGTMLVAGGIPTLQLSEVVEVGATPTTRATAGKMIRGREDHRATLLRDGRVVLIGGSDKVSHNDAEIFDPKTGSFKLARGVMKVRREDHSQTMLDDGRILVAGGEDDGDGSGKEDVVHTGAELFDPDTELFVDLGNLAEPRGRDDHCAVKLLDGRILLLGGEDVTGHGLDTAEIFDPSVLSTGMLTGGAGAGAGAGAAGGEAAVAAPATATQGSHPRADAAP